VTSLRDPLQVQLNRVHPARTGRVCDAARVRALARVTLTPPPSGISVGDGALFTARAVERVAPARYRGHERRAGERMRRLGRSTRATIGTEVA
jgi:hypothetical protein